MNRPLIPIDITKMPDLVRLVEEMETSNHPRLLKRDSKPVAMLTPVGDSWETPNRKAKSQRHYKAFLATAGSLQGLIDAETLKEDIRESRTSMRSPVSL